MILLAFNHSCPVHALFCVFTYTYAPFARFFAEKSTASAVLFSMMFAFGK